MEAEVTEQHCLVSGSVCFYTAPRTLNPEVASPTVWEHFLNWGPLSQMTLAYVKQIYN